MTSACRREQGGEGRREVPPARGRRLELLLLALRLWRRLRAARGSSVFFAPHEGDSHLSPAHTTRRGGGLPADRRFGPVPSWDMSGGSQKLYPHAYTPQTMWCRCCWASAGRTATGSEQTRDSRCIFLSRGGGKALVIVLATIGLNTLLNGELPVPAPRRSIPRHRPPVPRY